ncbi:hypothetical protein MXB_2925 [Myxobolus squamalis]|nr:hypothetical protein MXB_2925 [Myxobolus squamalis]
MPPTIISDRSHESHNIKTEFPSTDVPVTPEYPMRFSSTESRQALQPTILFPDSNDFNNQFGGTQRSVTTNQQPFPRILPSPDPQIQKKKTVDELLMENLDFGKYNIEFIQAHAPPSIPIIWNSQDASSVENSKPYYNIATSSKSTNPFL